jgi:hypothetical protein
MAGDRVLSGAVRLSVGATNLAGSSLNAANSV